MAGFANLATATTASNVAVAPAVAPVVAQVEAVRAPMAVTAPVATPAHAPPKTVCTITVNSPDEKDIFQRYLPADGYRFVELVERGRPDWLGSACRAGVQCDVLVISGHFDAGTEFYTDRLDQRESLPVEEMERVACSEACGGLFSQLKEVYLFGCNTLNGEVAESTTAEIARTLARSGYSSDDAAQLAQILDRRYAESNRDTMRRIFSNVPVIYGFSSLAPLGRVAGPLLGKVLAGGAARRGRQRHVEPDAVEGIRTVVDDRGGRTGRLRGARAGSSAVLRVRQRAHARWPIGSTPCTT